MIKLTVRVLPIALALLGASACSHAEKPAEHGRPAASAPARELSSAVHDLSDARCDLEERCNHVGAGQTYENREACETKMHGSIGDDLNTNDCPHGIADSKLSSCLSDIHAEKCGNPIEALSRWNACRKGEICAD
jgi:hypothetical protein